MRDPGCDIKIFVAGFRKAGCGRVLNVDGRMRDALRNKLSDRGGMAGLNQIAAKRGIENAHVGTSKKLL